MAQASNVRYLDDSRNLRHRRNGNYKAIALGCRTSSEALKKALKSLRQKTVLVPRIALSGWLVSAISALGWFACQVKTSDQVAFTVVFATVIVSAAATGLHLVREVGRFGRREYSGPLLQAMTMAEAEERKSDPKNDDGTWSSYLVAHELVDVEVLNDISALDDDREELLNVMRQAAAVLNDKCRWQDPAHDRFKDFI